jgi:hypothetical protein
MGVQYSTTEDVCWAHESLIFNYGGCPMSPWEFNIQLRRMSTGPMGV